MRRSVALATLATLVGVGAALGADAPADDAATSGAASPSERLERQLTELESSGAAALHETYPPPTVTADGWLVYDARSDEPIAGKDAGTPRPIASLAKLMTALVAVERLDLDELVTIPAAVNDLPADAARMDARAGEKWPMRDLLRAMLAHSANDAALALAHHMGDGDEDRFVELMNEKAEKLGMPDTTFASSTGLDSTGRSSTSTPIDLVTLTQAALAEDSIASAVAEPSVKLTRPDGTKLAPLPNRNPLLGSYDGVDGVKTGFTDAAGYMLVTHHEDAKSGGELIVVTFASTSEEARKRDGRLLLDWARPLRQRLLVVEGGTPLGTVPVQRSDEHVEVFACDDLHATARVGQNVEHEVVLPRSLEAPISAGDEVGELRVHAGLPQPTEAEDGESTGSVDLDVTTVPICAGSDVAKLGGWDRFVDRAQDWRSAWRAGVDEVEDSWSSLREQAT